MLISLVVVVVVIIIAFPPSLGNETKLKEKIAQKTEIDPKQIISAKDGFNRTLLIIINKCGTRKERRKSAGIK